MFVVFQIKTLFKEETMQHLADETPSLECSTSGSSWMQITFTLDIGRYQTLRNCAESARLTVPGFVREIVMDALSRPSREAVPAWPELD